MGPSLCVCFQQEDLTPLQIKAQAVVTEIQDLAADIKSSQQLWMNRQGVLVGLTQEMEANSREILKLETEFTIMHQKKVRLEGTRTHRHTHTRCQENYCCRSPTISNPHQVRWSQRTKTSWSWKRTPRR